MRAFNSSFAIAMLVPIVLFTPGRLAADEDTASVAGVVVLDGKPLAGVRVIFHVGDGQFVGGKTDDNGKYKITRVPTGSYKITVEMPPGSKTRLPDKYSVEDRAVMSAQVKKGANDLNLEVTSK
ncbi:MAG TPA: carboxypeptidase-like regulatory domain-containing protein [Gemmataceae bacterium]|nr:carboxypeptidase-like regulatory domain-containing protein [Gemmataceae bacterium]